MALPGTENWKSMVKDAAATAAARGIVEPDKLEKYISWDWRGAASAANLPNFIHDVKVALGLADEPSIDEPKVRAFLEEFFKAKGLPVPAKLKINIGGGRSVVRVALGDLGCVVMKKETVKIYIDALPNGDLTIGFQPAGATYVLKESNEAENAPVLSESMAAYTAKL